MILRLKNYPATYIAIKSTRNCKIYLSSGMSLSDNVDSTISKTDR